MKHLNSSVPLSQHYTDGAEVVCLFHRQTPDGHRRYNLNKKPILITTLSGVGNKDRKAVVYARLQTMTKKKA